MNKKKAKNNWFKTIITVIAVILCITIGYSIKTIVSLHIENEELKEEKQELIDERDKLKLELENVNTAEFIEEQARLQLKLIKPDEILFVLPEEVDEEN
ncbi:MAG TPA: septum formation initiator family protein [Anaerovoracaceae bacterium]|nr:septum formation initiator family protein [Anaerovoracaceae bacterium]